MITFTDEDYDFLSTQEHKLRRAVYGKIYTPSSEEDWKKIVDIYNSYFNMSEPYNTFCNNCRFIILEKIGKIYFRMKDALENKEVEAIDVRDDITSAHYTSEITTQENNKEEIDYGRETYKKEQKKSSSLRGNSKKTRN